MRDVQQGSDTVTRCKRIIAEAEDSFMRRLSNGECRDLLKDNTVLGSDEIRLVVQFLRGDD